MFAPVFLFFNGVWHVGCELRLKSAHSQSTWRTFAHNVVGTPPTLRDFAHTIRIKTLFFQNLLKNFSFFLMFF